MCVKITEKILKNEFSLDEFNLNKMKYLTIDAVDKGDQDKTLTNNKKCLHFNLQKKNTLKLVATIYRFLLQLKSRFFHSKFI